jgi:hypothetical protein
MITPKIWRHIAVSSIAAGPAGGFILGLMNAGDPDPNPIGRLVYACMMAVVTPLHGGFPPRDEAGLGHSYNAWPHIIIASLLIFGWLVYRDRTLSENAK